MIGNTNAPKYKKHTKYNVSIEGRLSMKEFRIQNKVRNNPPLSYKTNNDQEKICIQIINDALKRAANDDKLLHRLSLMTALNEFHIQKCVCSTIKPKLLPYPDIYDATTCSEFVADFFNYEPLKDPFKPPSFLPSPTQTIEWGIGDCFDLAIVLTSFLIGAGYDAYVVFGCGPQWICQRNKSRTFTNHLNDSSEINRNDDEIGEAQMDGQMELSHQSLHHTDTRGNTLKSRENDDDENRYVHSWVLIKPGLRRDIQSSIFVEPSTGKMYPADMNGPYTEVFAVWNTKNYWAHIPYEDGPGIPVFDSFGEYDRWLPVFHNTPSRFYQTQKSSLQNFQNTSVKPFDPPVSWVQNLHIDSYLYEYRYPPNGQRVSHYISSKVELFSKCKDRQGVLRRITKYEDVTHFQVEECSEFFGDDQRTDCLIKRIKRPLEMYYHEYFSTKQKFAISEWIEVIGVKREMRFRAKSRKDGLMSREEIFGQMIIEKYTGRPDRLSKRSIHLRASVQNLDAKSDDGPVLKLIGIEHLDTMIVKQIEDEFIILDDKLPLQIEKRTYYLDHQRIECSYRCYDAGYISKQTCTLDKSNKLVEPCDYHQVGETFGNILNSEKETILLVRKLHQLSIEYHTLRIKGEEDELSSA